ncbi:TIGR03756 family integrating conjugative element protein [Salmonella enterica]|nr:TIGR03756 family integrating conjugative element protein [Salmonella enterica]EAU5603460.1 TIGR03756 family integrating conjugative element protein [Salmonella enterica]EGL8271378.1 TIGR03756 family integrating conjugative element protein [Salmonella enterica]EJU5332295.1 TIGR03756 family integrating conjugative element protein [Salmonella enterica]
MKYPRLKRMLLSVMLITGGTDVQATLNTAAIMASSVSPSCISWRISGICYWLMCTPFGCTIKTSIKVHHFIPEAVVSAYQEPGGNPWAEMSVVSQTAGGLENAVTGALSGLTAGGGNQEQKIPGTRKNNLHFKYADAIGHPSTLLIGGQIPGYSCTSAATPLLPYFLSTLDTLVWRTGVPEAVYPEALIPGRREIGSTSAQNMWGNIYPRSGFVTQQDDYKAGAIVVQRVADVITRANQIHVYKPLTGHPSAGYWPPEPVKENTGTQNHKWQPLSPTLSMSCSVFPNTGKTAENGNYAWTLWQPYSCCKRRGQTFLYSTDIN